MTYDYLYQGTKYLLTTTSTTNVPTHWDWVEYLLFLPQWASLDKQRSVDLSKHVEDHHRFTWYWQMCKGETGGLEFNRKPILVLWNPQAYGDAFERWKCLGIKKGLKDVTILHRAMVVVCSGLAEAARLSE